MTRVLISGMAGFLASHVCEHLLRTTDWELVSLDRLDTSGSLNRLADIECWEREKKRVTLLWHDLKSPISNSLAKRIGHIDVIMHLAASTHVDRSISDPLSFVMDNVVGSCNLLDYARTLPGLHRMIYFSTDEVMGPSDGHFFHEWDRHKAANPYCMHPDTPILMADGSERSIAEVKVGDRVMSFDFSQKHPAIGEVLHTWKYQAADLLRVKIRNREILCTPGHRFFVKRPKRFINKSFDYDQDTTALSILELAASELRDGDWIATTRHIVSQNRRRRYTMKDMDFARFLGYFMGDGCIKTSHSRKNNRYQKTIVLADEKKSFVEFYNSFLPNKGHLFKHKTKECWYTQTGNIALIRRLEDMPGVTDHANKKRIPDSVMNADNMVVQQFIAGLFDADGSFTNGKAEICSHSDTMIRQVKTLLLRLGISCGQSHTKVVVADGLSLRRFKTFIPALKLHAIPREGPNPQRTSEGEIIWQPISAPTHVSYQGDVHDFEVGYKFMGEMIPLHSYIVEQDIIVHNSATKSGAEQLCWAYQNTYKVPVFVARGMNIMGERQHVEKFIPSTIKKILAGEEVIIHADPTCTIPGARSYIHARNVADALMFLLNKAEVGEAYHVIGEREVNNLEMAELISRELGIPLRFKLVDFHSSRPGHDILYRLDGGRMARMGWKCPVPFEDSLRRTIKWYVEHPQWLL